MEINKIYRTTVGADLSALIRINLSSSVAGRNSTTVMLSAAKHLAAHRARPFAEFTLSATNVLRVTLLANLG